MPVKEAICFLYLEEIGGKLCVKVAGTQFQIAGQEVEMGFSSCFASAMLR
jgi:hypothetical protein